MLLKGKYGAGTDFQESYMDFIARPGSDGTQQRPVRTLHEMLLTLNSRNHEGLRPYTINENVEPEKILQTANGGSLYLLAGHRDMDMWDSEIASAEATIGAFSCNADKPGAPYHAIMIAARRVNAEIVIVDLPPSKGAFTRNVIMSSDYFMVPTKPDYFSYEAVESLIERFVYNPDGKTGQAARNGPWIEYSKTFLVPQTEKSEYYFPNKTPKFLGYIVSDYQANKLGPLQQGIPTDTTAKNVERWMGKIHTAFVRGSAELRNARLVDGTLTPMALEERAYAQLDRREFILAKYRSFGHLQALSHHYGIPVPFLRDDQIVYVGENGVIEPIKDKRGIKHYHKKIETFRAFTENVVWTLLSLIRLDHPDDETTPEPRPLAVAGGGGASAAASVASATPSRRRASPASGSSAKPAPARKRPSSVAPPSPAAICATAATAAAAALSDGGAAADIIASTDAGASPNANAPCSTTVGTPVTEPPVDAPDAMVVSEEQETDDEEDEESAEDWILTAIGRAVRRALVNGGETDGN
jgi:hypothetical protein